MLAQRWMWIGWPAFLAACLTETLVFALVDPQDLHWFSHPLELSAQGVYTLAFFAFWAINYLACSMTLFLATTPDDKHHGSHHQAHPQH